MQTKSKDVIFVVVMIKIIHFLFQSGSQDFQKKGSSFIGEIDCVEETQMPEIIDETQGCDANQVQILQEQFQYNSLPSLNGMK